MQISVCSHMGTLLHSIQVPLRSHFKCQSHTKSKDEISQTLQKIREAPVSLCSPEKETQSNTESPELFHEVKNLPKIQVLIWEGDIYLYLLLGDQFSHSVPQFPNGKEKTHVDNTLKSWK